MTRPLRIGLIGHGAIGGAFRECLGAAGPGAELVAVLTRATRPGLPAGLSVTAVEELLAAAPDVVVECAGQDALRAHAPALLEAGRTVVVASVGALADDALRSALAAAAERGRGRMLIASGAVAGLDGLAAARAVGLDRVAYRQRAPVTSWLGHPIAPPDLASRPEHTVFAGTARDAARLFPKNANVTAAVALAGAGLDATLVELVSDRGIARNRHEISAEGAFGALRVEVDAVPIAEGVRSSRLVAGSLFHAATREGSRIVV